MRNLLHCSRFFPLILALFAIPSLAPAEDLGRVIYTRREGTGILVHADRGDIHISFPAPTIVHIRDTRAGADGLPSPCVEPKPQNDKVAFEALDARFQVLQTDALRVEMQREPFRLTIKDRSDKILLADDGEGISALADGKTRWQATFEQQGPIRGFGSGEIAPGAKSSINFAPSPTETSGGIRVAPAPFGRLSSRCALVLRSAGRSSLTFSEAGRLDFSTNGAFEAWVCLLENDAHYFGTLQYLLGRPAFVPRWLLGTGYALESYGTSGIVRSLATRLKEEGFGADWIFFPASRAQAKGWNSPFASFSADPEVWGQPSAIFEMLEKEGAHAVFEAPSRFQSEAKSLSVSQMKKNGAAASAPASMLLAPFDYGSATVREKFGKELAGLRDQGFGDWLLSEDDLPLETEVSRKAGYSEGVARAALRAQTWYESLSSVDARTDERRFVFDRYARADLNRRNHLPAPWRIDPAIDTPAEAYEMASVAAANALPMWGLELPVQPAAYPSQEAQCRWLQAAVLAPYVLLRAPSWDEASIPQDVADLNYEFRRLFAVRARLRPWMYTLARSASITGTPICQAVEGAAPDKSAALSFAGDVIALASDPDAPFSVQLDLPEGEWIDLNDASVYRGGRAVEVSLQPRKIPAFARRGALIPFWGDVEGSDVCYFTARLYPSASGQYALYEDAGDGEGFESGQFAVTNFSWQYQAKENALDLTITGPLGDYAPEVSPRDMLVQVHSSRVPLAVFTDDKPLKRTHFIAGASPLLESRAPLQLVSETLPSGATWDHDGKNFLYLWLPERNGSSTIRVFLAASIDSEGRPEF